MPLYEYECTACHKRTEKIQKFSDPEITTCPKCGGVLERVISAPAISFKGGGWFADGYGSAKPAPSAGGSSESGGTEGATKASEGSESKPSNDSVGAAPAPSSAPATAPAVSPTSAPASLSASSENK